MIPIEIAYPQENFFLSIELDTPKTVGFVLTQYIYPRYPQAQHQTVGIFSQRCDLDTVLQPFDRIEIYQPLIADPKTQRRKRVENTSSTKKS